VSGNSRVIAVTGQRGRACMVVCVAVLTPGKNSTFYSLHFIFFTPSSFLAVMIKCFLPSSFHRDNGTQSHTIRLQ